MTATSLTQGASSDYIRAQNILRGKGSLPEVYVYVEGLDDVAFWKECLRPFSLDYTFKVTQFRKPDRSIAEGKSCLIDSIGLESLGPFKYVAVDADYDWIIDNYRPSTTSDSLSKIICENDYILHTYLYSIENYKCHPMCLAGMMDKIAGESEEGGLMHFFDSFSTAMENLFLLHLVSIGKCDGVYPLKQFKKDVNALTFEKTTMELDEKGKAYIENREKELKDYLDQNYEEFDYYRRKLKELGFDGSRYYLLMQGHLIQNMLVKKHWPEKIFEVRCRVMDEMCGCGNEIQISKRVKQLEKITCIITLTESDHLKPRNAVLKDIRYRLDQLLCDCTDASKAKEGYIFLKERLERAFGKR